MKSRIIYVPIEAYKSRYTEYTSVADGVYEYWFKKFGIDYVPIRPSNKVHEITQGIVLDYKLRTAWGFEQCNNLVNLIAEDLVRPYRDVIYFEDFWTPGFEMIPYAQSLRFGSNISKHVPVYSFCHAQSTDPYDFTASWASWMRGMEQGWASYQSGILCASDEMSRQWALGGLPATKLHACGHTYSAEVVRKMFNIPEDVRNIARKDRVIFSSRWDAEKNPWFYLALAARFAKSHPSVEFTICTSLDKLTSNDPSALQALQKYQDMYTNVKVYEGLTKPEYFSMLLTSKVQFNCASQDFISYTLLDSALAGCAPLYPNLLTFPAALNKSTKNLYIVPGDTFGMARMSFPPSTAVNSAAVRLLQLLNEPWQDYSWIWKKYESSTQRKLRIMGFDVGPVAPINELNALSVEDLIDYLDIVQH